MQSTFKYFILLGSLLLCVGINHVNAQDTIPEAKKTSTKWLYGCAVEVDAASVISSTLINSDTHSMIGDIQVNILNKYLPVIEFGYASADKLLTNNVGYKTNAIFGKIGIDFNLLKQKKDGKPAPNLFLIGARLGASNYTYDITNVTISGGYWGGSETKNYIKQPATSLWYELTAGIQVEIIKNIYLGWRVRSKKLLGSPKDGDVTPWYVPGLGINNGNSQWEFNYNVGFKF